MEHETVCEPQRKKVWPRLFLRASAGSRAGESDFATTRCLRLPVRITIRVHLTVGSRSSHLSDSAIFLWKGWRRPLVARVEELDSPNVLGARSG